MKILHIKRDYHTGKITAWTEVRDGCITEPLYNAMQGIDNDSVSSTDMFANWKQWHLAELASDKKESISHFDKLLDLAHASEYIGTDS